MLVSTRPEERPTRRPRWPWLLEWLALVALTASVWSAGGAQAVAAVLSFGVALALGLAAFMVRLLRACERRARWWTVPLLPALFLAAVLAREPLVRWVLDRRFDDAERELTSAAEAYLVDPAAPMPSRAGSFDLVDRQRAGNGGVVFYGAGMGPLILKRCGFAYLPGGSGEFEHLRGDWYLYCRG